MVDTPSQPGAHAAAMSVDGAGRGDASLSPLSRHLARGAVGFGLIGSAFALTPSLGAAALVLAPAGMVALRGCPTCWIAGLIETVSAGKLERACTEEGCELRPSSDAATRRALTHAGD